MPKTYTGPSPAPRLPARAQDTPLCIADGSSGQITITAPNGGYVRASPGQQSREVITLSATGQLGMAAPGQIQLTVVIRDLRRCGQAVS